MIAHEPRRLLSDARSRLRALVAMNVSNMETTQGVLAAAEDAGSPVILQISPGAINYAGYDTIVELVRREARRASVPVLVHLDHCRDPDLVRSAVADGFSSVMFDGSHLPFSENVRVTAQLVRAAHARGVAVEGEIGVIGGSESMSVEEARLATTEPHEAAAFVSETDVDILAPALGNLHRMHVDSVALDIDLIRALATAADRPLALHGGSGIHRSQLPAAIAGGVVKVNVSSRVGRSFAAGIREAWDTSPDNLDLRRYLGSGRERVRSLTAEYIELCGSGRAAARDSSARWIDAMVEPE